MIEMRYYCLELRINFNSALLANRLRDWGFTVFERSFRIAQYFIRG